MKFLIVYLDAGVTQLGANEMALEIERDYEGDVTKVEQFETTDQATRLSVPIVPDAAIDAGEDEGEFVGEHTESIAYKLEEHEVRPDGPETKEGGLIGQQPY